MSKAILISIQPKHLANILNGKKTIELRKTVPNCSLPIDVYIYCTSHKNYHQSLALVYSDDTFTSTEYEVDHYIPGGHDKECLLNNQVVAKFTLKKVEEIYHNSIPSEEYFFYIDENNKLDSSLMLNEKSCLNDNELEDYLEIKCDVCGYAWYIDNLVIFDKPKQLDEFWNCGKQVRGKKGTYQYSRLTTPPQSWQYVEDE